MKFDDPCDHLIGRAIEAHRFLGLRLRESAFGFGSLISFVLFVPFVAR